VKKGIDWSNYFIELIIVIIGISVAFWLNNIGERHKAKKQEISYLIDIKNDLKKDSLKLSYNIINNKKKSKKLKYGLNLVKEKAPVDSVFPYIIEIGNYAFFTPDNFTLISLLQSGDFKLIESKKIKRELLRLLQRYESIDNMQKNLLQALDDNFFPLLHTKVDISEFKVVDPDFLYGLEVKNFMAFTLNETSQHISNYTHAQNQINKVMELLEIELKN